LQLHCSLHWTGLCTVQVARVECRDSVGCLVVSNTASLVLPGRGGWGGPRTSPLCPSPAPRPARNPDCTLVTQTFLLVPLISLLAGVSHLCRPGSALPPDWGHKPHPYQSGCCRGAGFSCTNPAWPVHAGDCCAAAAGLGGGEGAGRWGRGRAAGPGQGAVGPAHRTRHTRTDPHHGGLAGGKHGPVRDPAERDSLPIRRQSYFLDHYTVFSNVIS